MTTRKDYIRGRSPKEFLGFSQAQIDTARKNLKGKVARDISRKLATTVGQYTRTAASQGATNLREVVEPDKVTGNLQGSIRAYNVDPSRFKAGANPLTRSVGITYAPYLDFLNDGTGPQGFPPARKTADGWSWKADGSDPKPYPTRDRFGKGEYGLLDWIEMKGLFPYSDKYTTQAELYGAIGKRISQGGLPKDGPRRYLEKAFDPYNETGQQQRNLWDSPLLAEMAINIADELVAAGPKSGNRAQWFNVMKTFLGGTGYKVLPQEFYTKRPEYLSNVVRSSE